MGKCLFAWTGLFYHSCRVFHEPYCVPMGSHPGRLPRFLHLRLLVMDCGGDLPNGRALRQVSSSIVASSFMILLKWISLLFRQLQHNCTGYCHSKLECRIHFYLGLTYDAALLEMSIGNQTQAPNAKGNCFAHGRTT